MGECFNEDSSLPCALDRIFDDATVFIIKGNSYRGQKCETIALSTSAPAALPKSQHYRKEKLVHWSFLSG